MRRFLWDDREISRAEAAAAIADCCTLAPRGLEMQKTRSDGGFDQYLAALPRDERAALNRLRRAVHAAAPGAEEGFSYGVPAFRLDGRPLVGFAAALDHCSFYPMSAAVLRAHAAELKRYETSKGTIRFPAGKPLPDALVRKLVKARVAELRSRARKHH